VRSQAVLGITKTIPETLGGAAKDTLAF